MPYILNELLNELGADHPKRVSFANAQESFEGVAKLTLCREKIGNSWHDKVVLAGLDQFCKELVEGSIPSTIYWNRASAWFGGTVFEQQESYSIPNCNSGWLPEFFLTLCALLPRFCLWASLLAATLLPEPLPILPSLLSRAVSFGITHFPANFKALCNYVFCFYGVGASDTLARLCNASCLSAFCTSTLVFPGTSYSQANFHTLNFPTLCISLFAPQHYTTLYFANTALVPSGISAQMIRQMWSHHVSWQWCFPALLNSM